MLSFMARSAVQKIITLFFVSVISFLVVYLAPGKHSQVDPLNPKFTPEKVERFRKNFMPWGTRLSPPISSRGRPRSCLIRG